MTLQDSFMVVSFGLATGFVTGFISWGIGFTVYSIIKVIKNSL